MSGINLMSNYLPILFNLIRILTPVPHFFEVCESTRLSNNFSLGEKGSRRRNKGAILFGRYIIFK